MAGPTSLTGQDLIDDASRRLMGYANALDEDTLLSFLNEGKDEVWAVLKTLQNDYFETKSQFADNTQVNYFGPMSTTQREYTLPVDLREIHFVEVVTAGFQQAIFTYKDASSEDWRSARRAANVDTTLSPSVEYFYTIIGKNLMEIAQFPETAFQVVLWYTRNLLDFEVSDPVDEVVLPFTHKIADFAVKKAMLGLQDQEQFNAWRTEWKDDILMIATSAGPRNQANPEFVEDFLG